MSSEKPNVPLEVKELLYGKKEAIEEYRKLETYCIQNSLIDEKNKNLLKGIDNMQIPESINLLMRYHLMYGLYKVHEFKEGEL